MKSGSGAMKSGRSARGGASAEQVKAIQQALKDAGHDPGEVDGKMGPKTQAALRDYQQKEGLKATGRLDSETAAKLGVQAGADASSTSPAASPSGSSAAPSASAPSGSSTSGGASGSSSTGAKTR
jgi:peptidoglycan hydrolase-like protein with peptidoglycan-binding domain